MLILLADDHQLVRAGIRPFLYELAPEVRLIEVESYQQALETETSPDLAILDFRMPGLESGGLEAFKKRFPAAPLVILSGSATLQDLLSAFHLGAAGYIPKTYSGMSMIHALRLVLSGERFFPTSMIDALLQQEKTPTLSAPPSVSSPLNVLSKLSVRERDILALMVQGGTNKEIARQLEVQEITVKVHLRNIYRKLGAANRAQAVRIALENGWQTSSSLLTAQTV